MSTDVLPATHHSPLLRAIRHHLGVVTVLVLLGALAGWLYTSSTSTTYTATARVLVNPAAGNPFAPTSGAVRQDELTSLETEAQVARSAEVLSTVTVSGVPLTVEGLQRDLQVTVPTNTQVLELSYTAADPGVARRVVNVAASAYLDNRVRRSEEVKAGRIEQVETQTAQVLSDLRAATSASQSGTPAERSFQAELATALRNELVNLRAQRTALETSESPAGVVITPASTPEETTDLVAAAAPVGGGLAGLALGCLAALAMERVRGVVRSAAEVEQAGLRVVGVVPPPRWWDRLLRRRKRTQGLDDTVRRLRASVLDADPRPSVIAVSTASSGEPGAQLGGVLAASVARAGLAAVLVRTSASPGGSGLVVEEGLAEVLLHERLDVLDLLQPTVEPLLCVLPAGGVTAHTRDLLLPDRVRAVLASLEESGSLVVVESPGLDSPEGEAVARAAALTLVVVTLGRTRRSALEQVSHQAARAGTPIGVLVWNRRDALRRGSGTTELPPSAPEQAQRTTPRLRANSRR